MYEQDYLLKVIEEFFQSLNKAIHGTHCDGVNAESQDRLVDFYAPYFQAESSFFYVNSTLTIFTFLRERCHVNDLQSYIEMLSELLYQDAMLKNESSLKSSLLEKALFFFEYAKKESDTYSLDREERISNIKILLAVEKNRK